VFYDGNDVVGGGFILKWLLLINDW
jgi:hypothetical protein